MKSIKINFAFCILLFTFCNYAIAQNICIKGNVIDSETKAPIHGVNVFIKNTFIGTTTDFNGNFNMICQPEDTAILVLSCIGYKTYETKIFLSETVNLNIKLNPDIIFLEDIVISTAKNEITSFEQTIPASIISKEAIVESGVQNIADIVEKEPAVSLAGIGYHRAPSIRGLAQKRVVVMVDGERISTDMNIGPPGTYINPLNIERIEILRGPYSTLYGSDAVGGVMNIITKDYSKPLTNKYVGGTFAGNYNSINNGYNANLSLNSKIADKLFFNVSGGKRKVDSYKDRDGNEVQGTNYKEQYLAGNLTYQPNIHHKLQLNTLLSVADTIGKSSFSPYLNALHPNDNHYKLGLNYEWRNITGWLPKMTIRASRNRNEMTLRIYNYYQIHTGKGKNINFNKKNLYHTDYVYQHDFHFIINKKLKVLAGFDGYQRDDIHLDQETWLYSYDSLNSDNFYIDTLFKKLPKDTIIAQAYQRSLGAFVQANYILSHKFSFNGGIRWNKFKTVAELVDESAVTPPYFDYSKNVHTTKAKDDEAFSGNLGISYMPEKNINITANIGRAFRVPTTKELFVDMQTPQGMNYSNDSLVPEKSLNIDLGIKLRNKSGNMSLTFFRNKIDDMVILQWDSLHTKGTFKNQNSVIYGGEFAFNYQIIKKLSVFGNISKIYGSGDNNEVLTDIPPFQINLQTRYFIKEKIFYVALSGKYSAKQSDVATGDIPNNEFFVFDFLSGWNIRKNLHINFSVKNILNEDYREHYLFDWMKAPGRSFNVGINYSF